MLDTDAGWIPDPDWTVETPEATLAETERTYSMATVDDLLDAATYALTHEDGNNARLLSQAAIVMVEIVESQHAARSHARQVAARELRRQAYAAKS